VNTPCALQGYALTASGPTASWVLRFSRCSAFELTIRQSDPAGNKRGGKQGLEHRRIRILRSSGKTDAGARFVELNHDACEAAARLLVRAQSLGATRPEHYLMPKNLSRISYGEHKGARGYDPLQHQEMWDTAWRSLTEAAGFPSLRFHDLRHSFISHLVERGVPLGVIQTFVGHLSARMLRHYTHISSGAAREAVERLDAEPLLPPTLTERREVIQ
jgi:integrase